MNDKSELVEVFVGSPWQTGLVKSLLEDAGIEAFLNNEIMGTIAPWNTGNPGEGAIQVIVSSANLEDAKAIVADFLQNIKE